MFQDNSIPQVGTQVLKERVRATRRQMEGDQSEHYHSAVLFIASSTPTFCGPSAPLQYCGDSKPHIPTDGSVADGSSGTPKTQGMLGMWHRTVWRSVRLGSCPPSHNPSPGAVPWGSLGWHRWTFIQPNIISTHTYTTYISLYIIVWWDRWLKDPGLGGVLFCYSGREGFVCGKVSLFSFFFSNISGEAVYIIGKFNEIMEEHDICSPVCVSDGHDRIMFIHLQEWGW